ncbi:MAG: CorA family divalent cation transporter [Lachnospiraceae bacterium]|nr:CorA family divalent cation transporter [Lachnospiraceae bacterium]MDD3795817.1 CorA family divalent cation transporter [Lachnospiraceae bacterium]
MKEIKKEIVFSLGERLEQIEKQTALEQEIPSVFLTTSRYARELLEETKMNYEGDLNIRDIGFSKVETQQECLWGSFYIPKLVDVEGPKYCIMFFINEKHIVIVDDENFSIRLVYRIQRRRIHQGDTKEKFIYNFISEFTNRDLMVLATYEKRLMEMETEVLEDKISELQGKIVPMRNELLTLQEYYDEIADMGKELEENENGFFAKDQLRYFGTISDRADRLMNKTGQLLEYAKQVKEDYQSNINGKQNNNMQFLTIISTIFLPLTLITSWYGMNFQNMPELAEGYPGVIGLSILVIVTCIIIFKKKHIF